MNKYDNISLSAYNPMSFQEIAMVPMMKRQQHDNTLKEYEKLRQGLVNIDPHDKNYDLALKLRSEYETKLNEQSLNLSKNGINPHSTEAFLKLNEDYNHAMGPMGLVGQVNKNKSSFIEQRANYLKTATEKGQTPAEAQRHLDEYDKKYLSVDTPELDEKGRINMYKAPTDIVQAVDGNKIIMDTLGDVGFNAVKNGNVKLVKGADGISTYVTKYSQTHDNKDNIAGLEFGLKALNDRLRNPNDPWYQDRAYKGIKGTADIDDFMTNVMKSKKITERADFYDQDQQSRITNPESKENPNQPEDLQLLDVTNDPDSTDMKKLTYGEAKLEKIKLENKRLSSNLTSAEVSKLNELKDYIGSADDELSKDPKTKQLFNTLNLAEASFNDKLSAKEKKFNKLLKDNKITTKVNSTVGGNGTVSYVLDGKEVFGDDYKIIKDLSNRRISQLSQKSQDYYNHRNYTAQHNSQYSPGYIFSVKENTPASHELNRVNEAVTNTMKHVSSANSNGLIYSVKGSEGTFRSLGKNDPDGIVSLLSNSNNMRIIGMKPVRGSGLPTLTIEADLNENSKGYNLDGYWGANNETIGKGKGTITYKIDMNQLSNLQGDENTYGTNNFSYELAKYLHNYGGEKGKKMFQTMVTGIAEHIENKSKR